MPVPSKETIAGSLYRSAEIRASDLGLSFHANVNSRMKGMAEHGAAVISSRMENKPSDRAERYGRVGIRIGTQVMMVFVDEMALERLKSPDYINQYGSELREDLWTKVHDLLCPIWPIC